MSPHWVLGFAPIWRLAGLWICAQPFLVAIAHALPRGAEFLEGDLVILAVLVALGSQGGVSRERMEYLRHLPFPRGHMERQSHFIALLLVVLASAFAYAGELSGCVRYAFAWLAWKVGGGVLAAWEPHLFRALWLNLFTLPLLAYGVVVVFLQRLRNLPGPERISRARDILLLCLPLAYFFSSLWLWGGPAVVEFAHDPWMRCLPGALAGLACWPLARGLLRRADSHGIDAYPVEESAWES